MRFIHTADWHVGKVFRFVDEATQGVLQDARLEAITTIGRLAREHRAAAVLIGGDLFDAEGVCDVTLMRPIERMRGCPWTAWHIIPGNHDPHRTAGLHERLLRKGLPENVHVHLTPGPVPLSGESWLLPAPLARARMARDPTAWMDDAPTPHGMLRIGLAHGSMRDFGDTPNVLERERAHRAGLDYLALGDWHQTLRIDPRTWYSGTPERDGFGQTEAGAVLLVELLGPGAPPAVTTLATGRFHWHHEQAVVHGATDLEALGERLRARLPDPACLLVRLDVEGTLSLAERLYFEEVIGQRLRAALRFVELRDHVVSAPSRDDLEALGGGGVLRAVADALLAKIDRAGDDERVLTERALLRLFSEQQRIAGA